jgi:hypothetical protein
VPDTRNLYQLSLRIEAIDDTIRSIDNFADSGIPIFGNNATRLGMLMQNVGSHHQLLAEGFCPFGIITCDKADDVMQVVASSRRPDQLASHVASCRLTFHAGCLRHGRVDPSLFGLRQETQFSRRFPSGKPRRVTANGIEDNFFLCHHSEYVLPSNQGNMEKSNSHKQMQSDSILLLLSANRTASVPCRALTLYSETVD